MEYSIRSVWVSTTKRGLAVGTSAALMGVVLWVMRAHTAHAGINVLTSQGPDGGSVQALAVDPSAPGTLYAGTANAGVIKSTDGGATWNAVNVGLNATAVQALVIDPTTPSTDIALGNGDISACLAGDANQDGQLTVDEIPPP